MLKESFLDNLLSQIKRLVPKPIFDFFAPMYHVSLAYAGAVIYGFPSKKLKVIGVTGTKGKSTVVYLVSKIFESADKKVAACGSLGYKILDKEWPNNLKMTMPGRFRLQRLMAEAVNAGCEYFILEVTSEGIKQKRHIGINFDCAVFTNLHKEHIESHGSFKNYCMAKQELFKVTKNIHVINADDKHNELFGNFPAKHKIFFGLEKGDMVANKIKTSAEGTSFEIYGTNFNTRLAGEFNVMNFLSAISVGVMYGLDLPGMKPAIESVYSVPGRMEFIKRDPFNVVVDYAHTPESLRNVYETFHKNQKSEINPKNPVGDLGSPLWDSKSQIPAQNGQGSFNKIEQQNSKQESRANATVLSAGKLVCVLGAAGGGRDKWKRPEFGKIAAEYCDEIILTNEDPYDEMPEKIIEDIFSGISSSLKFENLKVYKILDRREAIKKALSLAQKGDTVVITGKGVESSMALANGEKIPWSDKEAVADADMPG